MVKDSGTVWTKIKKEIGIWRIAALPGFAVTTVVVIARLNGLLQPLEWIALDSFFRLRPSEPTDNRITIIGINENDNKSAGAYSIKDKEIAALIRKVQSYQPKVIGLNLLQNVRVEPGEKELINVLKESENVIALEKVLPKTYAPPPNVPSDRLGFSDVLPDEDGNVRRLLLGTPVLKGDQRDYKFSLALQIAKFYLFSKGIDLDNGIRDRDAMRFGSIEIPRIVRNNGGYVGIDAGGVQTLLNWRSGEKPFQVISLNQIKTGKFDPTLFRDRIILIGIVDPDASKYISTNVFNNSQRRIFGVEFQAHATSQIISAVLDKRPLLQVWSDEWEYLWIIIWGFISIIIGRLTQSALKNLLAIGVTSFLLTGGSYLLFIWGWWIPVVVPNLLILCGGLSAFIFYERDQALQSQINERQRAIEDTFIYIHNGPLQTLANILRYVQEEDCPQDKLYNQLKNLNEEIREIGEHLKSEALSQSESFFLISGLKLNLKLPIHELLYEVYTSTLKRDLPHFQNLKLKARSFEPIDEQHLSTQQKRELCQFLEEALCNVGKHAVGVKRIQATGKENEGWYTLSIKDNGCGINSNLENKGTKQAINLARKLGGRFKRESGSRRGTLCELTWPLKKHRSQLKFFKVFNPNTPD
jgi:CHASE2 domain-containing sensor protein